MFSLTWYTTKQHTIISDDGSTIQQLYSYLKNDAQSVKVYECSTGLELDPERGLRSFPFCCDINFEHRGRHRDGCSGLG